MRENLGGSLLAVLKWTVSLCNRKSVPPYTHTYKHMYIKLLDAFAHIKQIDSFSAITASAICELEKG